MFGSHLFRSPPKMFHVDANSRIALFDICRCELGYFAHLDIARVFKAQIAAHRFVGFAQFAWPCRDYCFGMMDVGMRQDGLLKMDHPMKESIDFLPKRRQRVLSARPGLSLETFAETKLVKERKSVASGKSVSLRVALVGSRIIK